MKCYVSEKVFVNFVMSQIFCQDHKMMNVNDCYILHFEHSTLTSCTL